MDYEQISPKDTSSVPAVESTSIAGEATAAAAAATSKCVMLADEDENDDDSSCSSSSELFSDSSDDEGENKGGELGAQSMEFEDEPDQTVTAAATGAAAAKTTTTQTTITTAAQILEEEANNNNGGMSFPRPHPNDPRFRARPPLPAAAAAALSEGGGMAAILPSTTAALHPMMENNDSASSSPFTGAQLTQPQQLQLQQYSGASGISSNVNALDPFGVAEFSSSSGSSFPMRQPLAASPKPQSVPSTPVDYVPRSSERKVEMDRKEEEKDKITWDDAEKDNNTKMDGAAEGSRITTSGGLSQVNSEGDLHNTNDSETTTTTTPTIATTTTATTTTTTIAPPANQMDDLVPLPDDVIHIDEVEWATPEELADPTHETEKASRPKFDREEDPCGCVPDGSGAMCCVDLSCVLFACQEECRYNCMAGELCGNKRITRKQWKNLRVFNAGLKGRGLRTLERIAKYELITEYVGVAVKKKHLDDLFRRYRNERNLYIMSLDNDVYIDARKRGGIARYINHSCEPNCAVHRWKVRGVSRAGIFALRDIEPGEELGFDYQWERKRGRAPTKCHCKTSSCRGTLELPKVASLEDEELEIKLTGHWKMPPSFKAGGEIVNRCVKVYYDGNHEYFAADVCKYDEKTGKHLLMYKQDLEEYWEDLSKEQWMILDEEMEQFVIAKKSNRPISSSPIFSQPGSPLESEALQQTKVKNYVIVQTPVKEALTAKHVITKCQNHFRVQINILRCVTYASSSLEGDEEEAIEESRALEQSKDGNAWKLTITGLEPLKARSFLEKNIEFIQQKLDGEGGSQVVSCDSSAGSAKTQDSASNNVVQEMVVPRCIVDQLKKRLWFIRNQCRNISVTFAHSESKSKKFAKIILEGALMHDVRRAEEILWREVVRLCHWAKASATPVGVFQNLGFLGGELPSEQFHRLFQVSKDRLSQDCIEDLRGSSFVSSFEDTHRCSLWVQAEEDKGRIDSKNCVVNQAVPNSPRKIFFCCEPKRVPNLWTLIQMRAAELARGVKYMPLGSDRIYQPVLLQKLKRSGLQRDDFFFDYVWRTTGARVSVDTLTRNHLRIDAGGVKEKNQSPQIDDDESSKHSDVDRRIAFAEELIRLQIELLRDHFIQQQRWGFGRDWTLLDTETKAAEPETLQHAAPSRTLSPKLGGPGAARSAFEPRAVAGACMEMTEIISYLGLDGSVAAHATIILYRFLHQISTLATHLKLREIALACVFLANKAQKIVKWKRLENVLEAAYRIFYAGASFSEESEEAAIWEKRALAAESEILTTLDYDVFWPGVNWIMATATESGGVAGPLAQNAMELALSGPVLAAGPTLWLKYGPEYAFAAMAGFISVSLDRLFGALSLIPLKVSHAAELIAKSVQSNSFGRKTPKSRNHELLNGGKKTLLNNVPHIKKICTDQMSKGLPDSIMSDSPLAQRLKMVARHDRLRRVFRGVDNSLLKELILPIVDGIRAESKCKIFFEASSTEGQEDILLEGSWRALSIADHLLKAASMGSLPSSLRSDNQEPTIEAAGFTENIPKPVLDAPAGTDMTGCQVVSSTDEPPEIQHNFPAGSVAPTAGHRLPSSVDVLDQSEGLVKMQAKLQPGVLKMSSINTADGWYGTIHSGNCGGPTEIRRTVGGKSCVAGRIPESFLVGAGLRWWIPPRYGPSLSGSLCDIFSVRQSLFVDDAAHIDALAKLSRELGGTTEKHNVCDSTFPVLASLATENNSDEQTGAGNRFVAVSLQRWPAEKLEARERAKIAGLGAGKKTAMEMGFSAAALQEMELLNMLHFMISAPQGHPNFILPVAVAIPDENDDPSHIANTNSPDAKSDSNGGVFSLLGTSDENERKAKQEQKRMSMLKGPHLVFEPTPFIMQKIMSRSRKQGGAEGSKQDGALLTPPLLISWFHDLLSAVAHCHCNHIVLRTVRPDQILVDRSGVLKLSGLSRVFMLHPDERGRYLDPLKSTRGKRGDSSENEDVLSNPYVAPELLLGATRYTKESDIWSVGCLMAHFLLNKPLFSGRDRASKILSIYKIVGTPSSDNFADARKFPHYKETEKKYKRGVQKAFRFMMKDGELNADVFCGALDLLDLMLHLDPRKRLTAAEALEHNYLADYVENTNSDAFREEFVRDWMKLKARLMENDEVEAKKDEKKRRGREKEAKRKAWLMEASAGREDEDMDELYNLDDLLGKDTNDAKKFKGDDQDRS